MQVLLEKNCYIQMESSEWEIETISRSFVVMFRCEHEVSFLIFVEIRSSGTTRNSIQHKG
jgi:hypothetical protein